jgi:hypothetical protein
MSEHHTHLESDASGLVARIRLALDQLVEACDCAREVMAEANAFLDKPNEADAPIAIAFRSAPSNHVSDATFVPQWDSVRRVLSVNGRTIKHFRVPSRNQEAVLVAFEEEGWPQRIDDPLPFRAGLNAKYRLHFTIRRLNHGGKQQLIRFFGDGTGEGVCWEWTEVARKGAALLGRGAA